MKKLKENNLKGIISLLCIAVLCVSVICAVLLTGTKQIALASDSGQSLEQLCESYTNSDTVDGTTFSIRDYPSSLYNTMATLSYQSIKIQGDDPITKIVPKQYFIERGDHIYIGKEYGFFVNTVAQVGSSNNIVTVLVFDISTNTNLEETINRLIVRVEPIFQYYYGYVVASESRVFLPDGEIYKTYQDASADGSIVALPNIDDRFQQCERFYLKDISFGATLYNEQEFNVGNEDYQAEYDDGSFITMYDYYYEGVKYDSQGIDIDEAFSLAYSGLSILLSAVSLFPIPPYNFIAGCLSLAIAMEEYGSLINDVVDKNNEDIMGVELSNGRVTATCLYTTRRDQLAHYVDAQTRKPALTKSATIIIHGDDNTGNVWYQTGNSAEGYFTLSDSEDTTPWYTRYIQEIALSVVDKDGNEHVSQAVGATTHMLHNPIYKQGDVGSNELAFLPQGKQYVSFSPQFTSDYEITFDKPYEFNVAVVDTQTNQRTIITPVDGKFKYRFVGKNTYKLEVYSPYGDIIDMSIEPVDNTVSQSFDAKGQNVFKYENSKDQVVVLNSSNSNVKLIGVYQQNENGSLTSVPEIAGLKDCTKADMYMQAGKTYYVALENTLAEKTTASVQIEAKADAEFVNNMAIHFDNSANYKYYSFTPSQNGDYYITFENSETSQATDYTLNYYCFDQNRREIGFTGLDIGYLILNALESGNTYYIAISSTKETTVISNIKREEAKFAWKMKVNGVFEEIESTVYLKRGNTYEFGLWVDGVKARNYKCYIREQIKDYIKSDSTKPSLITILNNATDMMDITITAVIDEPEIGLYPNRLLIYAVYDESKVNVDINYVNTTEVVINDQNGAKEIKAWTGTIYLDTETIQVTNETNIYKEILIERKAWHWFRFSLNSITISSLYNDKTIDGLSISRTVYTMYSKTSVENGKTVYHIANGLQFYNIRQDLRYKRVLDNDISLKDFPTWKAISSLTCDIDGKGHSITDLKMILSAPYIYSRYGLVEANRATISNLTLADFNMSYGWEEKDSWMYVGAFAGINYGTIQNCQAYGSIYGYREYMSVGGITGQNNGNIIGTTYGRPVGNLASVVYSWGELGGIAGQNYGKIQHTRVQNTKIQHRVYGSSRSIGGIAGYAENCEISNCAVEDSTIENINDQEIKSFNPKMGIIVGHMTNGKITSVGARNVYTSTGKLGKDNKRFCFNGGWGFIGLMENCVVDGNPGQYTP